MKILSIDVDYAFSPDITKYDDYVKGSSISTKVEWEKLRQLGFHKPRVNQKKLDWECPLPEDFNTLLQTLKHNHNDILSTFG